ncbi:MAG TPA: hypothetical protein VGN32_10310 [Ktedonobacterales bacterium]|nr:hypothetical protein [Ktedonobacterales bacterium]
MRGKHIKIVTVALSSLLVMLFSTMSAGSAFAHPAGAAAATTNYTGKAGTVTRVTTAPRANGAAATHQPRVIPYRTPGSGVTPASGRGAPNVTGTPLTAEGGLLHNFNGLSDADQSAAQANPPAEVTPPDQGLCTGFDVSRKGHPQVVWEAVNSAVAEYTTGGKLLAGPFSFATFFDPNAFSDPRCFYDMQAHTFFFTVISCVTCGPPGTADSKNDIVVLNAHGRALYQVDSSLGGTCFGDQPKTGYDSHALYVSTDQFCGPSGNTYLGELLIGLSKPQLVAEAATVSQVSFGPLSIASIPVLGLEPAFGDDSGIEYLLNSFPFDQFGNNNSVSNQLGFWKVTGDQNITTATLSGQIIGSETYAFPVPAASTGTGAVTCVPFVVTVDCPGGILVQSEAFLNPDDDRMLQIQLVNDEQHGLQLYASLSTALTVGSDPSNRDGAAWFVLDPTHATITDQGYIAVAGAYLLYPSILHTNEGTTALAFTLTSTTINPSAAFVVRKSTSSVFGPVMPVALGTSPHVSFAGPLVGRTRWGDYSALELDPNGVDIWSATEYIPPKAHQDPVDNWGTRIWDVMGDH